MDCSKSLTVVVLMAVLGILMAMETRAQTQDCAAKLVPCANYLNSTKPPESCCQPLRETVQNQLDCLCKLYANPGILKSLGVNITQALGLPKYCGVSSDVSPCQKKASPVAPVASVPPPGGPASDGNGLSKMAWKAISSFLLFWASIIAC